MQKQQSFTQKIQLNFHLQEQGPTFQCKGWIKSGERTVIPSAMLGIREV